MNDSFVNAGLRAWHFTLVAFCLTVFAMGCIRIGPFNSSNSDSSSNEPSCTLYSWVASDGSFLIADSWSNRIRFVDTSGIITTIGGNGSTTPTTNDIAATSTGIYGPLHITYDPDGNILLPDVRGLIRKITVADGLVTTIAGTGSSGYSGDGGDPKNAQLSNTVWGVSVGPTGNIYISDSNNNVIRKIDASTGLITTVAGDGTDGFSGDGGNATDAQLNWPWHAVEDCFGNLYIADTSNNRIRKVDTNGIITTVAGTGTNTFNGDGPALTQNIQSPVSVAVDVSGNFYFTTYDHRVRKVDTLGNLTTIAGNGTNAYSGDGGPATSAEVYNPGSVTIGPNDEIYIADSYNNVIRKINSAGIISTIAGDNAAGGSYNAAHDNNPATSASLYRPFHGVP